MTYEEQYEKPSGWFMNNVQCCYNCKNLFKDIRLEHDYVFNNCMEHGYRLVRWNYVCKDYKGNHSLETNLIGHYEWRE